MIRAGGFAALAGTALLLAAPAAHAVDPPADSGFDIDDDAAFHAAGFKLVKGMWQACGDPGTESYLAGQIEQIADLNGDGAPEAVITESSGYCFGDAGSGYYIVSSDKAGKWHLIDSGQGVATFLASRGKDNWPDLEVGGPGFCFPVMRWDGKAYQFARNEYEGKPCKG